MSTLIPDYPETGALTVCPCCGDRGPPDTSAQPVEAKGAPEQIDAAWHPFTLIPTVVDDCHKADRAGEADRQRAEVAERELAEAKSKLAESNRLLEIGRRLMSGAGGFEPLWQDIRGFLADLSQHTAMAEASKLEVKP